MIWSRPALGDLVRLHAFLAESHPQVAAKVVEAITVTVGRLAQQPRLGVRLEGFEPHEVRRIIVKRYELRYALVDEQLQVLRLWHTREERDGVG